MGWFPPIKYHQFLVTTKLFTRQNILITAQVKHFNLKSTDTDGSVESSGPEGKTFAEVAENEVALGLTFASHVEHGPRDVDADPAFVKNCI
jgi:hypothetical protein